MIWLKTPSVAASSVSELMDNLAADSVTSTSFVVKLSHDREGAHREGTDVLHFHGHREEAAPAIRYKMQPA